MKPFGRLQITPFVEGEETLAVRQQRHFAAIEAGDVISAAEYTGFDLQIAHSRPAEGFDPALLPTLLQLEGLFRGAKQGKAPGPNGIPEWVWALDSRAAARAFLPIFLKSHFRLTEPVQFKSTTLIALFKGKGSPAVLANHRAIALLDGPGKALRRSLRPTFVALLPPPDQQQGGTPGSLLTGAHHLVRAHQQLALGLKAPAAALFLDCSSAYYRVLRQVFGRGPLENDEDVARLLAMLRVPPTALHEVCEWLSHTDLLAGAPAHCTALIRTFLCGTFFQIRGAPGLARTRAGQDRVTQWLTCSSRLSKQIFSGLSAISLPTSRPPTQSSARLMMVRRVLYRCGLTMLRFSLLSPLLRSCLPQLSTHCRLCTVSTRGELWRLIMLPANLRLFFPFVDLELARKSLFGRLVCFPFRLGVRPSMCTVSGHIPTLGAGSATVGGSCMISPSITLMPGPRLNLLLGKCFVAPPSLLPSGGSS